MSHFFADDGEKIHVQVSGDGTPIVMLHGWTSNHQEWFPFLATLNRHHRIYRWDARSHGGHEPLTATAPTVQRMAADFRNLLDHFHLDQVCAVGHSMGALTLWQYIQDHGCANLSKVCFIDQSPKLLTDPSWEHGIYGDFPAERAESFATSLAGDFAEGVLRLTAFGLNERARQKYDQNAPGWQKSRATLRALNPGPLIRCWESLTAADYRTVLEQIRIPAMLVYGGESNFYRTETAHYVASKIPNAVLHIYEGTDHSPHQWQRERFVKDLIEFIGI